VLWFSLWKHVLYSYSIYDVSTVQHNTIALYCTVLYCMQQNLKMSCRWMRRTSKQKPILRALKQIHLIMHFIWHPRPNPKAITFLPVRRAACHPNINRYGVSKDIISSAATERRPHGMEAKHIHSIRGG